MAALWLQLNFSTLISLFAPRLLAGFWFWPSTTLSSEPSCRPSMDLSSAKLSSTFPSSCREKQVRWQVSSRSINTWWISCTISWGDTWGRGAKRGDEIIWKCKSLEIFTAWEIWATLGSTDQSNMVFSKDSTTVQSYTRGHYCFFCKWHK